MAIPPPLPRSLHMAEAVEVRRLARRNQNGQAMGPKGIKTQRRLIDATVSLLETKPLRELRVADIARAAKTSPATFYLYFGDVSDAVLAGVAELSQSTPELIEIARRDWSKDTHATVRALVKSYFEFWNCHHTLFRVRNLAAEEGDVRFRAAREQSIRPLLEALTDQINRAQADERISSGIHPPSLAGALLAMVERLAGVIRTHSRDSGITMDSMLTAAGHIIASALGVGD